MKRTSFENYLEQSLKDFSTYVHQPVTRQEVLTTFFVPKMANRISSYRPKDGTKNAIVLVGEYCCGKKKKKKKFVENHPEFTLISLDEFTGLELKRMTPKELNQLESMDYIGNRDFGLELEKGHQNIIVDGNWLHMNSRGALLKALDELNYHTCIFFFTPGIDSWECKIRNRCSEIVAAMLCEIPMYELLIGTDPIKEFATKMNLSTEAAKTLILLYPGFSSILEKEQYTQKQTFIDANSFIQTKFHIWEFGADELCVVNPDIDPYI